jgi:LPS sulfotransferase NodH
MRDGKITAIFVLSAPRSGSTWLSTVLGSNTWAGSLGECYRYFTQRSSVCSLCQADGLPECSALHGISKVAPSDAFFFAAERLGKSVLFDSSKNMGWCNQFLRRDDIEAKLIHLVRNPCGFVESQWRRQPQFSHDQLLENWEAINRRIEVFAAASGAPHILACYDDLADDPDAHFPKLCDFIGFKWEPEAINYWLKPHHGLAANGASSLYLRGRQQNVYLTGDDDFYSGLTERRTAADRRWAERLPAEFCEKAIASPYAKYLRGRIGSDLDQLS